MCKCVWHIRFHAHSERFGTVFRCLYVYLYRYGFSAIGFKLTYELWIHLICTRTYKTSNKCPHEFFFLLKQQRYRAFLQHIRYSNIYIFENIDSRFNLIFSSIKWLFGGQSDKRQHKINDALVDSIAMATLNIYI